MAIDMKAIETTYSGYKFRSRTEARWAVFFDTLEIEWEYEKEGYDLSGNFYLPDFWLPHVYDRYGKKGIWVEIKGEPSTKKEDKLCELLAKDTKHSVYLFCGLPDHYHDCGYHFGKDGYWDNYMKFQMCRKGHVNLMYLEGNYDGDKCFDKKCKEKKYFSYSKIEEATIAAKQARFEYKNNRKNKYL